MSQLAKCQQCQASTRQAISDMLHLKRRFSMFQDILRESPIYQELVEQGREEERQQELQRQRQTLMSFVQRHFPEISALAKLQVDSVADPEFLQTVILKLL